MNVSFKEVDATDGLELCDPLMAIKRASTTNYSEHRVILGKV